MQHTKNTFVREGIKRKIQKLEIEMQEKIEIKIMRERKGEDGCRSESERSVPVKESKTHSYKICKHCQKLFMSDAPQNAQRLKYTVRGAQKMLFPPAPGSSKNITSLLKNIHN